MEILSYLRVSTDLQTIEPQRMELAAYCQRQGWEIAQEYSDVISGTKAKREGLDALFARCKQGGVDVVLVVKLDRLGRSTANVVTLVAKLKEMNVSVICTSQGIDTRESNPCGKLIMTIMAAFAEMERDLIVERTRAGLAVARAKGKIIGQPSKVLPSPEKQAMIVQEWNAGGRKGGCKGLAALLGGCSSQTAWKRAKMYPVKELAEEWV